MSLSDLVRRTYANLLLHLPHNRQKWAHHMDIHLPILSPAPVLKNNPYARWLVLRTLNCIENRKLSAAASRRLYRLHFYCSEDSFPDRALYNFLCGMYSEQMGHPHKMASRFRLANKFGHTYHMIHAKLGFYYKSDQHLYGRAEEELLKAIDCIYQHSPFRAESQKVISLLYAHIAACRVMMHHYDDAADALRIAAQNEEGNALLPVSRIMYHAAMREAAPLQHLLTPLAESFPETAENCRKQAELVLAEKHPHFTSLPIGSAEAIDEFWRTFLENEREMQRLIDADQRQAAMNLIMPLLKKMDIYTDDYWGSRLDYQGRSYRFILRSNYSRTYTPWMEAIMAACPPELHERWQISHEP